MSQRVLLTLGLCCCGFLTVHADELPRIEAGSLGLSTERQTEIDAAVMEGLQKKRMPGCVVLIGSSEGIAFLKAYGDRQVQPNRHPMTTDTVFDLASLTKPIATATSIMQLIEQGKVELDARVVEYLPDFAANGKDKITVRDLLVHQGGLIPDNHLRDYQDGPEEAFRRINALKLSAEPRTKFMYSDVGFLVLGRIVETVSGESLKDYTQRHIFEPLDMMETGYLPAKPLQERAAVTQQRDGKWMQGEVHDPRAYELGGVAGHAGLFSTAADLAKFATAFLDDGKPILSPKTFELMTDAYRVSRGVRGLGWDKKSPYSSNRGATMTDKAFGHGGFTGTAIWIDPGLDLYVIFLSNRVHPNGKGSVNRIAGEIGTIAADGVRSKSP
ncbi:serine hydrolase domain-containing protein [Thalassoroseus pseudoceratinae]|uniref:serine hydrolase domain-containing protein n=1 Tax=Thalassoroseus pseudoceratinae TaxID=2713176 RepID=UPI00141F1483|nr:serine hydrolase domain-containing protein [Thalassoroseus pseudoceratinae]